MSPSLVCAIADRYHSSSQRNISYLYVLHACINDYMCCFSLWTTNRNVGYILSMLEHNANSQWLRGGSLITFAAPLVTIKNYYFVF